MQIETNIKPCAPCMKEKEGNELQTIFYFWIHIDYHAERYMAKKWCKLGRHKNTCLIENMESFEVLMTECQLHDNNYYLADEVDLNQVKTTVQYLHYISPVVPENLQDRHLLKKNYKNM